MPGVLTGVKVVDLTDGFAGPLAAMMLADQGADVIKIDPTAARGRAPEPGERVWLRGKRRACYDRSDPASLSDLRDLVSSCDVLLETLGPGEAERLGLAGEAVESRNRGLIHCALSGYGDSATGAGRPAVDALVAARTGLMWEGRGSTGTTMNRLSGAADPLEGVPVAPDLREGPQRDGPLFSGVRYPSTAAAHLAVIGISAALRQRARTGRGQRVGTSLLQGALACTSITWQQAERPHTPGWLGWTSDPRGTKGFYRTADGRWIIQYVPLPSLLLNAPAGDHLEVSAEVTAPKDAALRLGVDIQDMVVLHHYMPTMRQNAARFTAADWLAVAAEAGVPLQVVQSPAQALEDPDFLADGSVIEIPDPELGGIRQLGLGYELSACPAGPPSPPRPAGADTAEVKGETAGRKGRPASAGAPAHAAGPADAPLTGVRVLDLGLAVAGPFGAQVLASLGADVIKINTTHDDYWLSTHYGMSCNRGKRSIALDLKSEAGRAVFSRLLASADVVHSNMRVAAAARLRVDYDSVRAERPDIIYCQVHGFEEGRRRQLPGNDPVIGALAGTLWVDGGLSSGGKPLWSLMSLGDTGSGLLSAAAVIQALYHREHTGQGQLVTTSILHAHLTNVSAAWCSPSTGHSADHPEPDAELFGWHALYRLYRTGDGWLCVAALSDDPIPALARALGDPGLAADARFASASSRARHDAVLAQRLEEAFAGRPTAYWMDALDREGVPAEDAAADGVMTLFSDPDLHQRGLIADFDHPLLGRMAAGGRGFDFGQSVVPPLGRAPLCGEHSTQVLEEAGYGSAEIAELIAGGWVMQSAATSAEEMLAAHQAAKASGQKRIV